MCGIAGGFWRDRSGSVERRLDAALSAMRHRGPNDQGYEIVEFGSTTAALGQTRLSVIDLSFGGHQPMFTADGRYALVFNGEIYNYRELRAELVDLNWQFRSQSDTEVLLHAWAQWGEACLVRLEGMFAFAVIDRQMARLTCVRDAFGIKPLFYEQRQGELLFASEQPALLALRGRALKADLQRGYDYLVHGDYDSQERTFIEGVRHLLPGHMIAFDLATAGEAAARQWWRPSIAPTSELSFAQAAEAVREQFLHNVRLHLRSDVPLGAALSGGIDSSAVVCAMRHVEPDAPIHTFSYIAQDSDLSEERWVDMVNQAVGGISHKVHATADELVRDIDRLVAAQGEPFGSTSIYAQYRVFELAKQKGMTVVLEGQGADELLAGYWGYPGHRMMSLMEEGRYREMLAFARNWGAWPTRSHRRAWMYFAHTALPNGLHALARRFSGRDAAPAWVDVAKLADAGVSLVESRPGRVDEGRRRRVVERLAYEAQERVLPGLLRHGDRNAMRFSIEGRVPFLTIPMADLLLSLPEHYLISDLGETKSVFRAAMRGIVPDAILDRKDKIGFATPERDWFMRIAPLLRSWLDDTQMVPFLRRAALQEQFDSIIAGRRPFNWQVWRWVNYVRWYQLSGMGAG